MQTFPSPELSLSTLEHHTTLKNTQDWSKAEERDWGQVTEARDEGRKRPWGLVAFFQDCEVTRPEG